MFGFDMDEQAEPQVDEARHGGRVLVQLVGGLKRRRDLRHGLVDRAVGERRLGLQPRLSDTGGGALGVPSAAYLTTLVVSCPDCSRSSNLSGWKSRERSSRAQLDDHRRQRHAAEPNRTIDEVSRCLKVTGGGHKTAASHPRFSVAGMGTTSDERGGSAGAVTAEGSLGTAREAVAGIFTTWLAERYPGTRWIVERREGDEGSRVAPWSGEVGGQVLGSQQTRSVA